MQGAATRRDGLDWLAERARWPNAESSHFVEAGGLRWHCQIAGSGPTLLLLHGTGASTHSWRDMLPLLAARFRVVVPDLPGHGFTQTPADRGLTLPGMATALGQLFAALSGPPLQVPPPAYAAGHSAGAAIMLRMCLDGIIAPAGALSINGALLPLGGAAGAVFAPLARLLFANPLVAGLLARRGTDAATVARLLNGTGSHIDAAGLAQYGRLFSSPAHVAATLGMMANWDLRPLANDLPKLRLPLVLVAGGNDRSIAPDTSFRVKAMVPGATVSYLRDLGHLAHEERPAELAEIIVSSALAAAVPVAR